MKTTDEDQVEIVDVYKAHVDAAMALRGLDEAQTHPWLYEDTELAKAETTVEQVQAGLQAEDLPPARFNQLLELEKAGRTYPLGLTEGQQELARAWDRVHRAEIRKARYVEPPVGGTVPVVDPSDTHRFIGHAGKPGTCAICGKGLGHDVHLVKVPDDTEADDPQGRDVINGLATSQRDHIK